MPNAEIKIRSDFPGGNIIVDGIDPENNSVRLRQDWSTSSAWWFWWYFQIESRPGETLTFRFGDKDVFTPTGPCYSFDGDNWQWLGTECVEENSFRFTFPEGHGSCYFALSIPYVEADLDRFLTGRPSIARHMLERTEQGREIECLTLPARDPQHAIFLAARHHACECIASFTLEGVFDYHLSGQDPFFTNHVSLTAIPFIDKDGVENGDPGKLRIPHDHNLDYGVNHYRITPKTVELIEEINPTLAVSLHCPWIRGGNNEDNFFVGSQFRQNVIDEIGTIIERTQTGELPFNSANNIPYGTGWNTLEETVTFSRYLNAENIIDAAFTIEVPYSHAGGVPVTKTNARLFGHDLARAVSLYLQH